jgi:hypothetical protein
MSYYRRRWYWRSEPTKYSILYGMLGDTVNDIKKAFLSLDSEKLNYVLEDYKESYGNSAYHYAQNTYLKWKTGKTKLSGQTMERLVELVPPHLMAEQRFQMLLKVVSKYKPEHQRINVRIDINDYQLGFNELDNLVKSISTQDELARIPKSVMQAANWLYNDDITAARSMLIEATKLEEKVIKRNTLRDIEIFKKTIRSGQVKSASYEAEFPGTTISATAIVPSKCFVASTCFGENAPETQALRNFRDARLVKSKMGIRFIVWYYKNGELLSRTIGRSFVFLKITRLALRTFIHLIKGN